MKKIIWNVFVSIILIIAIAGDYSLALKLNSEIGMRMQSYLQAIQNN